MLASGEVPEWLKGTGCKPVGESLRWFESNSLHAPLLVPLLPPHRELFSWFYGGGSVRMRGSCVLEGGSLI